MSGSTPLSLAIHKEVPETAAIMGRITIREQPSSAAVSRIASAGALGNVSRSTRNAQFVALALM